MFDSLKPKDDRFYMKTVSVREMKAQWAEIEEQVARGETFEVLNRGKPVVRIVSATPRRVVKWEDHLVTALPAKGMTGQEAVDADREGRW
jgi:prevent-host-death family protein